jgi:hypothetical protein
MNLGRLIGAGALTFAVACSSGGGSGNFVPQSGGSAGTGAFASGGGAGGGSGNAAGAAGSASGGTGGVQPKSCVPPCGNGEVCADGVCTPLPAQCPCPLESYCDLAANTCVAGCIGDEHCSPGEFCDVDVRQCKLGCRNAGECGDDANPCTSVSCDKGTCLYPPVAGDMACADDGNPCTGDVCSGGVCTHPAGNEGQTCDTGNPCASSKCQSGSCVTTPLDGQSCMSDGNACTQDVCQGGACTHPAEPDAQACGTGSAPHLLDQCAGGSCTQPAAYCILKGAPSYGYEFYELVGTSYVLRGQNNSCYCYQGKLVLSYYANQPDSGSSKWSTPCTSCAELPPDGVYPDWHMTCF